MIVRALAAADEVNSLAVPAIRRNVELNTIIGSAINIVLLVAGVLAFFYLIYSGILYITAAGNPDAAKKGQQGIINAVIGLIIVGLAWVLVTAVNNFINTSAPAAS